MSKLCVNSFSALITAPETTRVKLAYLEINNGRN